MALGVHNPCSAQLLKMVGERRLRDVEQWHELADANLSGVLAQHVNELQADRVAEGFCHLGHPYRVIAIDVGIDNGLTAALTSRSLLLRNKLQIDGHRSTYINNSHVCRCNMIRAMKPSALA